MSGKSLSDESLTLLINLKKSGRPNDEIVRILSYKGFEPEKLELLLTQLDKSINRQRMAYLLKYKIKIFLMQALCVVVFLVSGGIVSSIKTSNTNLLPINIGGLNIVDSIIGTICLTLAVNSFLTFFYLFKGYFRS